MRLQYVPKTTSALQILQGCAILAMHTTLRFRCAKVDRLTNLSEFQLARIV